MTEFTSEWIAGAREVVGNDAASPSGQIAFIALDHIERLQKRVEWLEHFLEEAAHAAACGKNPADYLATEVPTTLRDEIERLQKRVDELEVQLKSKDIIINNQQGRLNYYATKDLLGGKNE